MNMRGATAELLGVSYVPQPAMAVSMAPRFRTMEGRPSFGFKVHLLLELM
jgi:hypothetical protein